MKMLQDILPPNPDGSSRFGPTEIKWSGPGPIPPVSAIVTITMNNLGRAEVLGYFLADGGIGFFIGLKVHLLDPPPWWTRQNEGVLVAHVFGSEVKP